MKSIHEHCKKQTDYNIEHSENRQVLSRKSVCLINKVMKYIDVYMYVCTLENSLIQCTHSVTIFASGKANIFFFVCAKFHYMEHMENSDIKQYIKAKFILLS